MLEFGTFILHHKSLISYCGCGGIWYTRKLEVLVGAIPWRFKSSHPHLKWERGRENGSFTGVEILKPQGFKEDPQLAETT